MTATLCDVCGERCGLTVYRLKAAGPAHVHDGDLIVEEEWLDVCPGCQAGVSDLTTTRTREELVWNERARAAAAEKGEGGAI